MLGTDAKGDLHWVRGQTPNAPVGTAVEPVTPIGAGRARRLAQPWLIHEKVDVERCVFLEDVTIPLYAFYANCPAGIVNLSMQKSRNPTRKDNWHGRIQIVTRSKQLPEPLFFRDVSNHVRIPSVRHMGISEFAGMMDFTCVDKEYLLLSEMHRVTEPHAGHGKLLFKFKRSFWHHYCKPRA